MKPYRSSPPSKALRKAKLDNLAIVPLSLLPYKAQYQELANRLPTGAVLFVLPSTSTSHQAARKMVNRLRSIGHIVSTARLEQFG